MKCRPYFLLVVAVMCFVGCGGGATQSSGTANLQTPSTKASGNEQQSFGEFSFMVPKGWSVVVPDREKTKAMILLGGTNWQNATAMIKVDVGSPSAPTAKQLAEGFANSSGGTVSAETLDFDGTPGVRASTSSTVLTTPRNLVVIYRGGKAYLLMAGAVEGVDPGEAISHIRKTWKWTQP